MAMADAFDAAKRISTITGEFFDFASERHFRRDQLPEIRRHAVILFCLGAIVSVLILFIALAASDLPSDRIILARMAAAVASLGCLLLLRWVKLRQIEPVLIVWQIVLIITSALIVVADSEIALTSVFVLPSLFYLAVPTNFRTTVAVSSSGSGVLFLAYSWAGGFSLDDLRLGIGLILLNVMFCVLKSRSGRLLRMQWATAQSHRQMLAELAENQTLLARTFDAVPIPVVVTDIETGTVTMANEAAERFLEVPEGGLPGREAKDFYMTEEDRTAFTGALRDGGKVREFRSVVRTDKDRRRTVMLAASSLSANSHHDGKMVASILDITEREERQKELRLAAAEYQALFDNAVVGIYRSTPEGKMLRANPALVRLNGYETEEELVSAVNDIATEWYVEPDRRDDWLRCMRDDGRVTDFVSQVYRHRTRERIWISENSWTMYDTNGNPEYFEGTLIEATERKRAEAEIEHMARHDLLTDLPNRRLLLERMETASQVQQDGGGSYAILCLDLDRFKAVNDAHGHEAGDMLLQDAAQRLRAACRKEDTIARIGGDEFTILIPFDGDLPALTIIASRILAAFAEPFDLYGTRAQIGTSVGIAIAPSDGTDPAMLIRKADLALYRAKNDGRNTFRFYNEELEAKLFAQAKGPVLVSLRSG